MEFIDIDIDQVVVIPDTPGRISKKSKTISKISSSRDSSMRNCVRDNRAFRESNRLVGEKVHAAGLYTHYGGDAARIQASNNPVPPSSSRNVQVSKNIAGKTIMHKDGHHGYKVVMVDDKISHSSFGGISSHHHRSYNPVLVEKGDYSKCSPIFKKHVLGARKKDEACMLSSNFVSSHAIGVSAKSTRNDKVKVGHDDHVRCNVSSVKGSDNTCLITSDNNSAPSFSRNDNKGKARVMVCLDEPVHSNSLCVNGYDNIYPIVSDYSPDKGPSVPPHLGKRLVRNVCISPHNIAKARRVEIISGVGSEKAECRAASGDSHPSEVTSKNNDAIRAKGKGIVIHDSSSNCHASRKNDAGHSTNKRRRVTFPEDCIILQDTCDNSNRDDTGRNTTTLSSTAFKDKTIISEHRFHTPSPSIKRSKKSSGNLEKSTEVTSFSSGAESSSLNSLRDHVSFPERHLGSSSAVDAFSPEVRQSITQTDNDSETRENQLKADEMLARELQEQLYNETPFFTNGESVSSLGGAVQPEDSQQASFPLHYAYDGVFPSYFARSPRHSLRSHFPSRRYQPWLSRSSSSRMSSPIYRRRTRSRRFASHMDLDMRMHLLEPMEARYYEHNQIPWIDHRHNSDREFGENDYEMLLALDDNNHADLGASVAQIANLPQSIVNNDNCETCSICLEKPVIGDTMRHLPCLHKFHKDCIDLWLRRKRSCPICKSGI